MSLAVPGQAAPLSIYVHGDHDQHVSRQLRESAVWEPYESSLLLQVLRPGQVFIDVGANIGYFSLLAAGVVGPKGRVFAFEPDPANFILMQRSIGHNQLSCIEAVNAGLAAQASDAQLYLSEHNLGDHQIFDAGDARRSVAISLLNGTDYLVARTNRIDLLKIDTQGSEYGVVAGLLPLLQAQAAPCRIIVELTPRSLRQCGSSGRQLIELLAQLNQPFWIVDHIEHRLVASDAAELAQWCDNVDAVPEDEGFMNIMVGPEPAIIGRQ
ncbi:FkbM family methyltransferase [Halioglobus maricola]|uniref:FkbM family methyltransferase n=1 Tax=Halioglobus maricola TaxID=2601894 RepID=UPI001F0E4361|nr:FkbM family methyltransferase [Halioglobus maricola]